MREEFKGLEVFLNRRAVDLFSNTIFNDMYITTLIVSVTFYFAFRIINVIFKIMTETFQ